MGEAPQRFEHGEAGFMLTHYRPECDSVCTNTCSCRLVPAGSFNVQDQASFSSIMPRLCLTWRAPRRRPPFSKS